MAWSPGSRDEVVSVEAEASAPVAVSAVPGPMSVAPSKNSTAPVGGPPLLLAFVIVAVNVTAWLKIDGLLLEPTVAAVTASTDWAVEPALPP